MKTARIMLDGIEVGDRRRPLNRSHVEALKVSIGEIGLRTPLTVVSQADGDDTRMILVAGLHRLEALREIGEEFVDCFVLQEGSDDAELWEIDENFARAELTDAQRADHHTRREGILVRKKLVSEPGRGGDRRNNGQVGRRSYTSEAAASTGQSERSVRRDLHRGKDIAPEILADVAGTGLDKGVVLDRLAATPREDQRAVLAEIKEHQDGEKLARSVNKTVARSNAEVAAESVLANMDLVQVDALMARLSHVTMKDFLAALSAVTAGARRVAA